MRRAADSGWSVVFTPDARCVHVGGASHGGRMFRENVRGHLRYLSLHGRPGEAERARRLLRSSLVLRGRLYRGERGRLYRDVAAVARLRRRRDAAGGRVAGRHERRVAARSARVRVVRRPRAGIARRVGARPPGLSAGIAWAFALVFAALGVTFLVSGSLTLTLVLSRRGGLAALPAAIRRGDERPAVAGGLVAAAGACSASRSGASQASVGGDGRFHLARVQKLLAFDDLSLGSANEFPDGGLHPGYAFPLWHGFLALVAKVSGADPVDVVLHGPTVLAPLAVVVGFEAGWALFRRVTPGRGRDGGRRRPRGDGARRRRRTDRAGASRDGLPATARPGCARAGSRVHEEPDPRRSRVDGRGVVGARRRPSRRTRSSSGSRSADSSPSGSCGDSAAPAPEPWRSVRS